MRLICPNCDAQYEVPDDVMSLDGRDVQCSNCGQTWFQEHPDAVTKAKAALQPAPGADQVPAGTAEEAGAVEPEPVAPERPAVDASAGQPPRRSLDPSVARLLREEAEIETQARQNDVSGSVESQPDLGLDNTEVSDEARKRAREARDRMTRIRGEGPAEITPETTAAIGSRRDLLPDIEEINSTLRANSDRSPGDDPGQTAQIETRERRSFRRGFVVAAVLVLALVLLYLYAPQLAEAVPQADPWISAYVGRVDELRMWLDGQAQGVLNWLDAAVASSSR